VRPPYRTLLAEIVNRPLGELAESLGELEHHGVLEVQPDGGYDFGHDLVRSAAYRRQSTPKRTMLHNRIGVVLDQDTDWTEFSELVTESYRLLAPKQLAALVETPPLH